MHCDKSMMQEIIICRCLCTRYYFFTYVLFCLVSICGEKHNNNHLKEKINNHQETCIPRFSKRVEIEHQTGKAKLKEMFVCNYKKIAN